MIATMAMRLFTRPTGGVSFRFSRSILAGRNSWTQVIPGIFGDSGYDGILLYDQEAGFAAFYDTDGEGSLIPLREYDDWRTSWTHIIVAPFADSRYSGVLLYDKSAGVLAIYATDGQGGINLIRQRDDWLTTWTHIVAVA
jgi:hypothetical protein